MITRRQFVKRSAATSLAVAASGLAAPAIASGAKIKVGYVTPLTGSLVGFSESDDYIVSSFLATDTGSNFEVIIKDSQSNPTRAAAVAKDLIIEDGINLMVVGATPDTTNPVVTTCEAEGIPVISTIAPWQPWFIGQQGNPTDPSSWAPFNYAFHYFFGLEDIIAAFLSMWSQIDTNKKIGGLFPNDSDGNAFGDPENGVAPAYNAAGYSILDPGRYQNLSDDFSAQINAFKAADCEIVNGIMIPPDCTTFRNQAIQQGFAPKIITMGKALLFPQSVAALGDAGHNLTTDVWWSATHPYKSSITGQSAKELAGDFTAKTGRPWTQPIGLVHTLFELAADVMGRAADPADPDAVVEAIGATDLQTLSGHIAWDGKGLPPFAAKNVCKTPVVGGQWRRQSDGNFELVIVENHNAPEIPTGGQMEELA